MILKLFVVSEGTSIDMRSNNVSIFTLLEEVGSPVFPVLVPRMIVTAIFERDAGEADVTYQLRAAIGDKVLFETPFAAEFQGRPRTRSVMEIGGIAIPGPGVIEFKLMKDGATVGRWDLQVTHVGLEQQELVLGAITAASAARPTLADTSARPGAAPGVTPPVPTQNG